MRTIKIKSFELKPAKNVAYVELVDIVSTGFKKPNMKTHEKDEQFGEVMFTHPTQEKLIGKIIVIDPYEKQDLNVLGTSLVKVLIDMPTILEFEVAKEPDVVKPSVKVLVPEEEYSGHDGYAVPVRGYKDE